MASLLGQRVNSFLNGILIFPNNTGVTGSIQTITDGAAGESALGLSNSQVNCGNITFTENTMSSTSGDISITRDLDIAGDIVQTGNLDITGDVDVTGNTVISGTLIVDGVPINGAAGGYYYPETYGAVGDGTTNDGPAFKSAITAITANGGGTLVLGPKTYLVDVDGVHSWAVQLVANLNILGQGVSSVIKLKAGQASGSTRVLSTDGTVLVPTYGINLSNFVVDGNLANQAVDPKEQMHGIFMTGCYNATIRNVEIKNCGGDGIFFYYDNGSNLCTGCVVDACIVHDGQRTGINFQGASNCVASNNVIYNLPDNWAFKMEHDSGNPSSYGNVWNNNIAYAVSGGISITSTATDGDYGMVIANNNFVLNTDSDAVNTINFDNVSKSIVSNNSLVGGRQASINIAGKASDLIISGNTLNGISTAGTASGISLGGGVSGAPVRITISNNNIRAMEQGIVCQYGTGGSPGNISIQNNLISGNTTSGIAIAEAASCSITGNLFFGNAYGIQGVDKSVSGAGILNLVVSNNIFSGSSSSGFDLHASALVVDAAVQGNSFVGESVATFTNSNLLTGKVSIAGNLGLTGASLGGYMGRNVCGTATFATAGTKAVTFTFNEPDTSYRIIATGQANQTFWVTSKAVGGFTLNSSNASSTAVVEWFMVRGN